MKQTAVEQMIDEFNEELKVAIEIGNKDKIRIIKHLITIATSYLPKEKEQMCKFAYKCHNHYKVNGDFKIEQYYNETYQQSHTPKHYRVWFEDTMEPDGGYWWNAVTDSCGGLYDPKHPNEERDSVQWYIDNGYKVEEVTNG